VQIKEYLDPMQSLSINCWGVDDPIEKKQRDDYACKLIYIVELCSLIAVYLVVGEETRNMKSLVDFSERCQGFITF